MLLIAGLGNPGREYDKTRHNAGFEVIDRLSAKLAIPLDRKRFHALMGEGSAAGRRLVLLKPQTYMNLSGQSIAQALQWYKLSPPQCLIISDDIDLPLGTVRLRAQGGAGTHNGWRNILLETGSQDFPRIRIGVGAPPAQWDLADWVLSRFDPSSAALMADTFQTAAEAALCFVGEGIQRAMNQYNQKPGAEHAEIV